MTARFLIAFAAATVLFGANVPQTVRADAPTPHCSLDRAHGLERQGSSEAAGSAASFARAVDHLRAASGEYALCAVQASGGAARLALWQQAQAALRAAESPELQVGTPHDVDALIAGVRNYDAAIADDRTIPGATRSLALTRFVGACMTSTPQGDEKAREAACNAEYAAVAASRKYLALTPGYHEIIAATPVAAASAMPSVAKMMTMPDGLQYADTVIGSGAEAKFGQHVSMQYVGTMSDGTVFDSSRSRSTPFDFTIGTGTVIECWDEGVIGMRVGGHRTLVCPPSIGYGGNRQGTIPPYSTLHFDLELVSVQP